MAARSERTLGDRLQVSVNTGVIVHGYQQPHVTSGFTASFPLVLPLLLLLWCHSAVLQWTCNRELNFYNYGLQPPEPTSQMKIFIKHEQPKQITLWLLVMSVARFGSFKARGRNAWPNAVYNWLCFISSHIKSPVIISLLKALCAPEELFFCGSLNFPQLAFSPTLQGWMNDFHHRNKNFWDWEKLLLHTKCN